MDEVPTDWECPDLFMQLLHKMDSWQWGAGQVLGIGFAPAALTTQLTTPGQVLLLVVCNMQGSRVLMQMMSASELVSGGQELAELVNRASEMRGDRWVLLGQKARLW
jgi:hypothetical protein